MMASSSELSLECKPQSYSMLLKSFADNQISDPKTQTQKLEEFLSRLEDERLKIDAFKRELPLCMTLLTNAMEASRQQLQSYHSNQTPRPILEEFIPLKKSLISECTDEKTLNMSDKANWMTTAQLWSQTSEGTKQQVALTPPNETEIGLNVSPKISLDNKQRNGGAFMPFSKERELNSTRVNPDLVLSNCMDKETEDNKFSEMDGKPNIEHDQGENTQTDSQMTAAIASNNNGSSNQTHRKARRCWSPDLHRRFVNALQMLGGSQVATPKQIRELMKVDGLTNDEVKSHLQKYRLHTRRTSPSPQSAGGPPPQLVVLGGLWVPQEYAAVHGGAPPPSLYGTPPHYYAPHEYFHTPPHSAALAAAHHHQQQQQQMHMYKPCLVAEKNSPGSNDARGDGSNKSGSVEDGKSESGEESKGLAALRAEGDESNGSKITLKF